MSSLSRDLIMAIVIVILGAIIVFAGPAACSRIRSMRAQSRVERAQSGAASNSAADAVNAVAASGGRETASEDLTRSNSQEIHNAPGADQKVDTGVDIAGRRALCMRAAYRHDSACRVFNPPAQ